MKILIILIGLLTVTGCNRGHKQQGRGILTDMDRFEVIPFFSPYENYDLDLLFQALVKELEAIGKVEVLHAEKKALYQNPKPATCMRISIGADPERGLDSVQIFSEVEVVSNKCKTSSMIYSLDMDNKGTLSYPELEKGKVIFKEGAKQDEVSQTPEIRIKTLIAKFAEKYQRDNPKDKTPIFYLYPPLFCD